MLSFPLLKEQKSLWNRKISEAAGSEQAREGWGHSSWRSIQEGGAHSSRESVQKGWGTSPSRVGIAFRWDGGHSFTDSMRRWEHNSRKSVQEGWGHSPLGRVSRGVDTPPGRPSRWGHSSWMLRVERKSPKGLLVRDNGFWDCV